MEDLSQNAPGLPVENVQDYPRPPALEPVPQPLRAVLAGHTVLETTRALRVLETHHPPTYYIPPEDIGAGLLSSGTARGSFCEWKGRASYFDLCAGDVTRRDAAWCYATPSRRFRELAGYIAFYAHALDAAWVGEVRVTPQPGSFYGGWVTPNLTGLIKGGPGTEGW